MNNPEELMMDGSERRQAMMMDAILGAIALKRTVATREPSRQSSLPSRPYGRVSTYRKEGNDNG
jgi:hypothetical protein